jgi:coenzyme F420-reducing hydrogenase delta subunit
VEGIKKLLLQIGLEAERIEMFNLSSAMGPQFAQYAGEMTERIQRLGPSPLRRRQPLAVGRN